MQAAEKPVPTSLKLPAAVKRDIDEAARAATSVFEAFGSSASRVLGKDDT